MKSDYATTRHPRFSLWLASLAAGFRLLALTGTAIVLTTLLVPAASHAQNLYVANRGNNTVGEYNATTGAAITTFANPVDLDEPNGLAILNVPEPSTWAAVLSGGGSLLVIQRWRSRA